MLNTVDSPSSVRFRGPSRRATLTRATVLPEGQQRRELTMAEAAEMIGVTERTSRWWRVRYDTEGVEGGDRRLGRASRPGGAGG